MEGQGGTRSDCKALPAQGPTRLGGASVPRTCVAIFKAFIGVGILFMPSAFANGGLGFALLSMAGSALVSTMGMLKLSECHKRTHVSYPEMGRVAYGTVGYALISFQLALSQFCFAATAVVFISHTWRSASVYLGFPWISDLWKHAVILLVMVPLAWIRRIHKMIWTNAVGGICILVGVSYVGVQAAATIAQSGVSPGVTMFNAHRCLSFLGTAIYAFEGIALVIPIRESMHDQRRWPAVFTAMVVLIFCLLCGFSTICYLAWVPSVEAVVLSQPEPSVALTAIQLSYIVAMFCTIPIVLYPTFTIIEVHVFRHMQFGCKRKWLKNLLRTSLAMLNVLMAAVMGAELEIFISLIGAFCSLPLALIFPALLHQRIIGSRPK